MRKITKWVSAALILAVLLVTVVVALARAREHPQAWRQLQAGFEAFGGLIGVAIIVLCAVVLLVIADAWFAGHERKPDR